MTIDLDALAAALPGRRHSISKVLGAHEAQGAFQSCWKLAGAPAAGANPPVFTAGSGYIPTRATAGALGQANPSANLYIAQASLLSALSGTLAPPAGTLIIADRLWACSGFSGTTTTVQTVTTPGSLTAGRDPNTGDDVEMWIEFYTAIGASASNLLITYVDQGGTAGNTVTYAHPANAPTANQMVPILDLAAGDTGVQQLTSVDWSATTGTAGDFGITLLRRLAEIPIAAGAVTNLNFADLGLPEVLDDACLFFIWQHASTVLTTGTPLLGHLSLAELTP
jgi:hypothetical protein